MPVIHEKFPKPLPPMPGRLSPLPSDARTVPGYVVPYASGLPRILFVHDYDPVSRQTQVELRGIGYPVAWIGRGEEIAAGVAFGPDVVVGDRAAVGGRVDELLAALGGTCPMVVIKPAAPAGRAPDRRPAGGSHLVLGVLDQAYKMDALTEMLTAVTPQERDAAVLERAMLDALADGRCLLDNLYYDFLPKIDLRRDTIAGYEALARLRNLPSINPEILFTAVMDLPLEIAATLCAVRAALTLWRALAIEQRSAAVAVNCSQAVLADPGFQEALQREVRDRAVPVGVLLIEITEDARPVPIAALVTDMTTLREAGIRFSLDDFGKGATNFDRVFNLPISEVKIDRGFFRQCLEHPDRLGILEQVIRSCRQRGVQTVIEGIETDEHLVVARRLGATLAQGFYWGRPMPAGTFAHIRPY
ncbi:EAL domain-containing protein [Sphingomonas sp. Leaf20]|uniref:EAL domain-containing protein n=1 Tax=Sphingomonas sp. Leaf20 TaxID=1735685 RepID=UPI0006F65E4E|nr:EAL domain-containing protein [Sphingomonas sp. Leaf20]KQM72045.1 hypothetical protein ASE72_11315 [Sphingomonas sp. Leaf20]